MCPTGEKKIQIERIFVQPETKLYNSRQKSKVDKDGSSWRHFSSDAGIKNPRLSIRTPETVISLAI